MEGKNLSLGLLEGILLNLSRHPLQELTVASYIPNDVNLCGGHVARRTGLALSSCNEPSMLLLTGPNFSGKSVYMKQVGIHICSRQLGEIIADHEKVALLVYLAHIGR